MLMLQHESLLLLEICQTKPAYDRGYICMCTNEKKPLVFPGLLRGQKGRGPG